MASFCSYCPTCGHKHVLEAPPDPARGLRCVQCGATIRKPRPADAPAPLFAFTPAVHEDALVSSPAAASESSPLPAHEASKPPRVEDPHSRQPALEAADEPSPQVDVGVPPPAMELAPPVEASPPPEPMDLIAPPTDPEPEAPPAPRSPSRRLAISAEKPAPAPAVPMPEMEEEEEDDPPAKRRQRGKKTAADEPRRRWVPWAIAAGILAVVLGGGGAGAYFLLRNKGPSPKATKNGAPHKGPKKAPRVRAPVPSPRPASDPKAATEPVAKTRHGKATPITAVRLAAEYVADSAATNRKYAGALLEVTGFYWKTHKLQSLRPPARPHALFACAGRTVCCDLEGTPTDARQWQALTPQRPFTVRGVYSKDCFLQDCMLMPLKPPADHKYKDKVVEVAGHVEEVLLGSGQPYPVIKLENDTDGLLDVACFFRDTDEPMVREVLPGSRVVLRGMCSGRVDRPGRTGYSLRFDDCTVLPAPPGGRSLDIRQVVRAYEEDLRFELPPDPSDGETTALSLTVTDLGKIFGKDRDSLNNLRNRVLILTGRQKARDGFRHVLTLRGNDTKQELTIECRFTRRLFDDLDAGPEYTIQGRCAGLSDAMTLRLENCEPIDPTGTRDRRRLTADFFPHTPGQVLTYDLATFPALRKKPAVVRQVHRQTARGLVETTTIYVGTLSAGSLFDATEKGQWITAKGTRKIGGLPGLGYYRRIAGGFVEVGQYPVGKEGASLVWIPALKLRARVGDSWTWSHDGTEHRYTLARFDDYDGRTAAVVEEVMTRGKALTFEAVHVYVQGVGEVERREWQLVGPRDKVPVMEKKLVPDPPADDRSPKRPASLTTTPKP